MKGIKFLSKETGERKFLVDSSVGICPQIEDMKPKNHVPKSAKIRFIIYWQKENSEYEIRIVLPELIFERTDDA